MTAKEIKILKDELKMIILRIYDYSQNYIKYNCMILCMKTHTYLNIAKLNKC